MADSSVRHDTAILDRARSIAAIHSRILALRDEEADESYLAEYAVGPSDYAVSTAIRLLDGACDTLAPPFPELAAATDGEGGIQIYWVNAPLKRKVQLLVPGQAGEQMYIYHQSEMGIDAEHDVERQVTPELLAKRLKWLAGG